MSKIITVLTDFGMVDSYVGVLKGVMLGINPDIIFVDLTHSIPHGDIKRAAFCLFTAYRYFPKETIHLVVVDPGVGTTRKPLIVKTKDYCFVGPDNGVFSWIYAHEDFKVYEIKNVSPLACLPTGKISTTFHGRDIFAPTAARLSLGLRVTQLGKPLKRGISFNPPMPEVADTTIKGEVIDIDNFGNLITNISQELFKSKILPGVALCQRRMRLRSKPWAENPRFTIKIKNHPIHEIQTAYRGKSLIAIFGSSGLLEISLPGHSGAQFLNAKRGTKVDVYITQGFTKLRKH